VGSAEFIKSLAAFDDLWILGFRAIDFVLPPTALAALLPWWINDLPAATAAPTEANLRALFLAKPCAFRARTRIKTTKYITKRLQRTGTLGKTGDKR
jgi:hypothetical protein